MNLKLCSNGLPRSLASVPRTCHRRSDFTMEVPFAKWQRPWNPGAQSKMGTQHLLTFTCLGRCMNWSQTKHCLTRNEQNTRMIVCDIVVKPECFILPGTNFESHYLAVSRTANVKIHPNIPLCSLPRHAPNMLCFVSPT